MAYSIPVFVYPPTEKEPSGRIIRVSKILIGYLDSDNVVSEEQMATDEWIQTTLSVVYAYKETTTSVEVQRDQTYPDYITHINIKFAYKE